MPHFSKGLIEQAAMEWLSELGNECITGTELSRINLQTGIDDYSLVILENHLRPMLARFNPKISEDTLSDAYRKISHSTKSDLMKIIICFIAC